MCVWRGGEWMGLSPRMKGKLDFSWGRADEAVRDPPQGDPKPLRALQSHHRVGAS